MTQYRTYFAGSQGLLGYSLWVTNGTAQGTNVLPIGNAQGNQTPAALYAQGLTAFGSGLLFAGIGRDGLMALYVSDGTAAGTTELTTPGANAGGVFAEQYTDGPHGSSGTIFEMPGPFTVLAQGAAQQAVFVGVDAANRLQLFQTDGTSSGEVAAAGASADGLNPASMTAMGKLALFGGTDATGNIDLWVTDGSAAGTHALLPAGAAANGVHPYYIAALGARAVFTGSDAAGLGGLWVTDGTSAGTQEVAVAGAGGGPYGLDPSYITAFGSRALFVGMDDQGRDALWITDGTSAGTHEILPAGALASGMFTPYMYPSFTVWGDRVLFNGYAADGSDQLWITDGTSAGTIQLTNSAEGSYNDFGSPYTPETAVTGTRVVFGNYDTPSYVQQLWVTDGTPGGTMMLQPAGANANGLLPQNLTSIGTQAVFTGADAHQQFSLWITDGTSAGTHEIDTSLAAGGELSPTGFLTIATPQTNIQGPAGGGATILGSAGDDIIHTAGAGNVIETGGGSDVVNAGTGGATVYAYLGTPGTDSAMPEDGGQGLDETVNLQGSGNAIYGGNENFTIVGGTGGNTVAVGFGNNVISLFGSQNNVTLGSGISTVRFTGGAATVLLTDFGDTPPFAYDVTLLFTGTGNTLTNTAGTFAHSGFIGDRGTLSVTGGTGGGRFDLGWSTATLVTGGTGNVVHAGQGVSHIAPGSGSDTVELEASSFFDQIGGVVSVTLAGQDNLVQGVAQALTVTGGSGYGSFLLAGQSQYSYRAADNTVLARSYTITTGGDHNSFVLDGAFTNTIDTGYGNASVTIANPVAAAALATSRITFHGSGNTLSAGDASVTSSGGTGGGSFTLGDGADSISTTGLSNSITLGNGQDSVAAGSGQDQVQAGNGDDSITLAGSGNTVLAGNGADVVRGAASASHITLGDGSDQFLLTGGGNVLTAGNGADSVMLAGSGNMVFLGNGNDSVSGGAGANSVTLGTGQSSVGTSSVVLAGWGNSITAGAGHQTLDGGLGFTSIVLNGSTASVTLHGHNDSVTLNGAARASITDQSSNALLKIASALAQATVAGFGASSGAVLSLVGGVGGYASAAQVVAALQSDGHGGTKLALGATGFVDFTGAAPGAFHAGNFLV